MIRVRFAPSPTGHLHIGGGRTALFNFLYARSQNGQFLVRIEDTDRERSRPEFEKEILSSLEWLGLGWDEEVLRQTRRLSIYREQAEHLVRQGVAYEEAAAGKVAVRFKMPKRKAVFHDWVHGEVQFDTSLFDDLVIIKSDGFPTYHWACIVDDHDMQISHVIRGDDHLSNTPRQILLCEAMGWKPPKYAHLPLIAGTDGSPLSKRHGAVSLAGFRNQGFIPEGILNYLALLGWSAPGDQEIFTLPELVKKFSLKRINKASACFDIGKMEWLNGQHIRRLQESDYLDQITAFHSDLVKKCPPAVWRKLALLYRPRIKNFQDLLSQAAYCFSEVEDYAPELRDSFLGNRTLKRHLEAWLERAAELKDFEDPREIEKLTRETADGWGIEAKDLIHPLRFALTGQTASPGLFELMSILGKERCLKRLSLFLSQR